APRTDTSSTPAAAEKTLKRPVEPPPQPVVRVPVPAPVVPSPAVTREEPAEVSPSSSNTVATKAEAAADDLRRDRINRVADEARKVFAGADYDSGIIGADDHETRRLVGAELLSALVGRNTERR